MYFPYFLGPLHSFCSIFGTSHYSLEIPVVNSLSLSLSIFLLSLSLSLSYSLFIHFFHFLYLTTVKVIGRGFLLFIPPTISSCRFVLLKHRQREREKEKKSVEILIEDISTFSCVHLCDCTLSLPEMIYSSLCLLFSTILWERGAGRGEGSR